MTKNNVSFTSAVHWRERGVSLHGSKPGQRDTCLGTLNRRHCSMMGTTRDLMQ